MELRHLEQVLEVCRAGGFSSAARKLQISQPSLSKSIARVEAQMCLKLFERSDGAARPTAYGLFVAERAQALLDGVAALNRDLEQLIRGRQERLRIAVGPASRLKPLPELMRRIAARYPGLRVETMLETGPGVIRALNEGRVDVAFGYSEHAAQYGALIRKRLYEDPIILVARTGHPALALRNATAGMLLRYPFALPNVLPGFEVWAGPLSRQEQENLRAFVCDDFSLIVERVLMTDSIAIGPNFLFKDAIEDGRMARISSTFDLTYDCWMLTTAEGWRTPLIKAVGELAKAVVDGKALEDAA